MVDGGTTDTGGLGARLTRLQPRQRHPVPCPVLRERLTGSPRGTSSLVPAVPLFARPPARRLNCCYVRKLSVVRLHVYRLLQSRWNGSLASEYRPCERRCPHSRPPARLPASRNARNQAGAVHVTMTAAAIRTSDGTMT